MRGIKAVLLEMEKQPFGEQLGPRTDFDLQVLPGWAGICNRFKLSLERPQNLGMKKNTRWARAGIP